VTEETYAAFLRYSEEGPQNPELSLRRELQDSFASIVLRHLNVDLTSAVAPRSQPSG
jgi:hypothetical protein